MSFPCCWLYRAEKQKSFFSLPAKEVKTQSISYGGYVFYRRSQKTVFTLYPYHVWLLYQ